MQVQEIEVAQIDVGERYRKDLGEIEELAEDIKKKGLIQPITVTPDFRLIAGERRLRAFEALDIKTIPALVRTIEGELDLREVELMENIARKQMTWAERAELELEIHRLQKKRKTKWSQRDTAKMLGKSQARLNRHLILGAALSHIPELREAKTESEAWSRLNRLQEDLVYEELAQRMEKKLEESEEEDETDQATNEKKPSKKEKKKVAQQLKWAADHYMIGNALEKMREVAPGICHFAEVDPPYAIGLTEKRGRTVDTHTLDQYSEVSEEAYPDFLEETATEVYRILSTDSICIWWFGPSWFGLVRDTLREAGFTVSEIPAIWYKGQVGQTNSPESNLANSYEMFWLCRKGRPSFRKRGRSNVFEFAPVPPRDKIHSTERPVELMGEIIDTFVHPAARVLVPFLGSGVTLHALYQRNMVGFGWDLAEENRNRFLERIDNYDWTGGGEPEKESKKGSKAETGGRETSSGKRRQRGAA